MSIDEALTSEPVSFVQKTKVEPPAETKKRKEVDVGGLREILEESLRNIPPASDDAKNVGKNREESEEEVSGSKRKKKIKPGEKVKF